MTQPLQHVKDSRLLGNRPKDKCTCKSCDLCGIYRYLTANVFPLLHTNHFPVRKKNRLNKKLVLNCQVGHKLTFLSCVTSGEIVFFS